MHNSSLDANRFITFNDQIAAPAAGANLDVPIPGVAQVQLVYLAFELVADANVANRVVKLISDISGFARVLGSSGVAHTANLTFEYVASQAATTNAAGNISVYTIPLPFVRMKPGSSNDLTITVDNIQVGDQLSAAVAGWRLWRG